MDNAPVVPVGTLRFGVNAHSMENTPTKRLNDTRFGEGVVHVEDAKATYGMENNANVTIMKMHTILITTRTV